MRSLRMRSLKQIPRETIVQTLSSLPEKLGQLDFTSSQCCSNALLLFSFSKDLLTQLVFEMEQMEPYLPPSPGEPIPPPRRKPTIFPLLSVCKASYHCFKTFFTWKNPFELAETVPGI